jgi:predicted helicase
MDGKIHSTHDGIQAVTDLVQKFLCEEPPVIGRPKELASHMAKLAHLIRISIEEALKQESETGNLHGQLKAFQDTLIPDLKPDQFADMYAQTIAYGLFAAWERFPERPTGFQPVAGHGQDAHETRRFTRQEAAWNLPKTNPFLRKLFNDIAGVGLDDRVAWVVDDLAYLLHRADKAEVLRDFGKVTKQEDPVVHFYETFLSAYDPKMRKSRGVYYTPEPVVSYIVRSIDYLLKTKFDKPWGLADKDVMILDPACGTGTFLYFVIQQIYDTLKEKGQLGGWNDYVKNHLLPRIFGFELLMAPYTVAHMKLGMLLKNLGYDFTGDQRLRVYLTNSLDEAITKTEVLGFAGFITEEANQAVGAKRDVPIMVVLGNPPYYGESANRSEKKDVIQKGIRYIKGWEIEEGRARSIIDVAKRTIESKSQPTFIGKILKDYYICDKAWIKERSTKWLQDDYVKFLRWGQWRIECTGKGILAMITNHSYLDNPTFRGMRQSLINTFSEKYALDLHGNTKKKERTPEGGKDQNVFDIQQGVSISMFIKEPGKPTTALVNRADLWGVREEKYRQLLASDINNTIWKELTPESPFYLFMLRDTRLQNEYDKGWKVTRVFPVNSVGIVTARDDLTIRWSGQEIWDIVRQFANLPVEDAREKYHLGPDVRDWKVHLAQMDIGRSGPTQDKVVPILYRPFDQRFTYYTGKSTGFLCMPRPEVMRHMLAGENLAIITTRQTRDQWDVFATRLICGHKTCAAYDINSLFPLYLYPSSEADQKEIQFPKEPIWSPGKGGRIPNLSPEFIAAMEEKLGMKFVPDGKGDSETTFGPEDVLHYIYAIFHSPTYRTRYAEFLKIDFPRVPLTSNRELFRALCQKGEELIALHLMESPMLNRFITGFPMVGSNEVEAVQYVEANQRVYINKSQYFEGIKREVWEFHIGGYQVLHKWLKDRKGRALSWDDIQHYQKIVVALTETMRLMQEIDTIIPHWPLD